jgi:MbtH protein
MTDHPFDDDAAAFQVLLNHEAQYSIWPALREPPPGWRMVLPRTSRAACLRWIDAQWKDMRPQPLGSQ